MVNLDVFLNPASVAVIGATERPGSWGSFIMKGLLSKNFRGKIYPVNRKKDQLYNLPVTKDIRDIAEPVDLAILTIPGNAVEEVIKGCGEKGVKGVTIITAGFSEIYELEERKRKQVYLADLAHSYGIRLLGPNVSGTFNLFAGFNASAGPAEHLLPTPLGAICQGGYAFYDLLAAGFFRKMGVGKFIHTGNECDLTVTDFLEKFDNDSDVAAILMYLETIREGKRFVEVAAEITKKKPIVVYKAGRTPGSARAARSHTGALSGKFAIDKGLLSQIGVTLSPSMELLLPLGHALLERPPMKGNRVGIITIGGSWGVALSDALEEAGLIVPELSQNLQKTIRSFNIPLRASTRNPVDIGAAGSISSVELMQGIAREILNAGEVDALIMHGLGRPGAINESTPPEMEIYLEVGKKVISALQSLETELNMPVFIGSHYAPWESQLVWELNEQGIRVYNRLDEISLLLSLLHDRYKKFNPTP